jgi:hypothetical protein
MMDGQIITKRGYGDRLTPPGAALYLGISERTLRVWRDRHYGPKPDFNKRLWGFAYSYRIQVLSDFKLSMGLDPNGRHSW